MALVDDLERPGVPPLDEREQVLVGEARELGGELVAHSLHSTTPDTPRITRGRAIRYRRQRRAVIAATTSSWLTGRR